MRLWVYRGSASATWSVIVRQADGPSRYRDRLVARGVCPLPPGGLASTSAAAALVSALLSFLTLDELTGLAVSLEREALSAPLEGPQGGNPRGS